VRRLLVAVEALGSGWRVSALIGCTILAAEVGLLDFLTFSFGFGIALGSLFLLATSGLLLGLLLLLTTKGLAFPAPGDERYRLAAGEDGLHADGEDRLPAATDEWSRLAGEDGLLPAASGDERFVARLPVGDKRSRLAADDDEKPRLPAP
jgi:hypothetical protein